MMTKADDPSAPRPHVPKQSSPDESLKGILLAAQGIPHTEYIVARGTRKADGGIKIDEDHRHISQGLGQKFVKLYVEAYEKYDSAAQQFLCAPFLPITIEVGQTTYVDDDSKDSTKMTEYLQGFHIDSLLIVGLESSRGLCWMTLYRRHVPDDKKKFTDLEAELASYRIRAALFEWQLETGAPVIQPPHQERYRLLPLGRRALDVAMRLIRGVSHKNIATELGIEPTTVDDHVKKMKKRGLTVEVLLHRLLGPAPPARPPRQPD